MTDELVFAIVLDMEAALGVLEQSIQILAAGDPALASDADITRGALGLQRQIDRLKGLHALVIAEADRRELWRDSGARNVADWVAGKTNTSVGDTKARAALGSAMRKSKKLEDAVRNGDVTAASAQNVANAVNNPPDGAGAAADRWTEIHRQESDAQAAERRHLARSVRFGQPSDGMAETVVRLPEREHAELRATLGAIAGKPCQDDDRTTEQRLADGLIQLCAAYAKGDLTGGREGANVLITMTAATFAGADDEPATTAGGDHIPAHIARQIAENAALQRVVNVGGRVLDLGRGVRFATTDQYRALVVRDGGCRWPGCHIPAAWCDIDHVVPWERGGTTDLSNLVMWCRHHHNVKHRPGVTVHGAIDVLRVVLPDGTTIDCRIRAPLAA